MIKKLFVSDEDTKITNTIAGLALVITLLALYFLMKPADVYGYMINIAVSLVVGGAVYFIVELIRKSRSK